MRSLAFEPLGEHRAKWKARTTECLPYALGNTTGDAGFFAEVGYTDILDERGVTHIAFISLNVEGAEIEVLRGIDFSRVDIECFTIENDKGHVRQKRIREFMKDSGYKLEARLWLDEFYIQDSCGNHGLNGKGLVL